ncbi:putative entry exclusion protein TrbK-alt [Bradyrhizobium sp. AUGA SZCCT0240]|uniref:putative entry exclusion protein TrbK-alt n=1 Tax=Bradyrhizobium sp. AUGA SZCCT0240 TaxID=2807669 RepID=UPI001BA55086|nr:putative entry exclusion protein TrbK-alt [Bradyrhizobium sp. AUGA SZCCT0240]MBR1256375.1 putative entry exclusion protein TrbK-alt [Bradyrhizobium sp. AUGA SZCCT0240]
MTDTGPFKALSLLTSIGILVVAACTIQLRGGEEKSAPPKAEQTSDFDGSDLARCRTVTSEDATGYQHCQKVWAENRRRFFGRKDGATASRRSDPAASLTPAPKDESRMPQGYPSAALPEASKP